LTNVLKKWKFSRSESSNLAEELKVKGSDPNTYCPKIASKMSKRQDQKRNLHLGALNIRENAKPMN